MADIKVFISSVQAEFADERRRLYEYIRQDALLGQLTYRSSSFLQAIA